MDERTREMTNEIGRGTMQDDADIDLPLPDLVVAEDSAEQERRWAALDASVPCAHTIPGTCDYC